MSGNSAQSVHFTSSAFAAAIACSSRWHTTPTRSATRTTFTRPGIFATDCSLMETTLAPCDGGLTTRPCSMPGSLTSCTYSYVPNTFPGTSQRFTEVPTTV